MLGGCRAFELLRMQRVAGRGSAAAHGLPSRRWAQTNIVTALAAIAPSASTFPATGTLKTVDNASHNAIGNP